ncbi:MAG: YbjQ family protein [Chloroflexi bacterium]|nr:YbjQ family protein [Chloroflexota bacterium]
MIMTTTNTIPGREIAETIGLVSANAVRARHVGRDIMAGLKNLVGGEIGDYQELLERSREQALGELQQRAEQQGADAVVGLRMATASVAQGAAEVLAFGTAVKLA